MVNAQAVRAAHDMCEGVRAVASGAVRFEGTRIEIVAAREDEAELSDLLDPGRVEVEPSHHRRVHRIADVVEMGAHDLAADRSPSPQTDREVALTCRVEDDRPGTDVVLHRARRVVAPERVEGVGPGRNAGQEEMSGRVRDRAVHDVARVVEVGHCRARHESAEGIENEASNGRPRDGRGVKEEIDRGGQPVLHDGASGLRPLRGRIVGRHAVDADRDPVEVVVARRIRDGAVRGVAHRDDRIGERGRRGADRRSHRAVDRAEVRLRLEGHEMEHDVCVRGHLNRQGQNRALAPREVVDLDEVGAGRHVRERKAAVRVGHPVAEVFSGARTALAIGDDVKACRGLAVSLVHDVARERGPRGSNDHDVLRDSAAGGENRRDLIAGLSADGVDREQLDGADRKGPDRVGAVDRRVGRAAVSLALEEDALGRDEGVRDRCARLVDDLAPDVATPEENDVQSDALPRCEHLAEGVAVETRGRVDPEDLEHGSEPHRDVLNEEVSRGVRRGGREVAQEGLSRDVGDLRQPDDDGRVGDRQTVRPDDHSVD